ncbi:ABC transporter permease [Lactobacillus taiwanensis]|uniref:ABC transporter permease n=1 Tax=Lactobacillus taiwanensis TaxID=508451 RepID=UPI002557EDCD|nr:ABC transporter permease [Lactobacillus taiwanensis]
MIKRMSALIWLRFKLFTVNKAILFEIISPFIFTYFYKYLYSLQNISTQNSELLGFLIPFSLSIGIGIPIIAILSEEREKNSFSALMLSGVRYFEYLVSLIIVSLFFSLFIITIIPLILNSKVSILNFNYFFSSIFMAISVCLISLIAGLLAKTQVMGQVISLPVVFITSFLPMLATINNTCKVIVNYSFMSLFYKYIQSLSNDLKSLAIVLLWIVLLITINYLIVQIYRKEFLKL